MNPTLREQVARALFDPGQILPRIMDFIPPRWEGDSPEVEPLHRWQTRCVLAELRTYLLSDEVVERAAAGIADSEIAMYGWSEDEKPARTRLWVDEARAALQAALGEDNNGG